jgi:hypothetical protein
MRPSVLCSAHPSIHQPNPIQIQNTQTIPEIKTPVIRT